MEQFLLKRREKDGGGKKPQVCLVSLKFSKMNMPALHPYAFINV